MDQKYYRWFHSHISEKWLYYQEPIIALISKLRFIVWKVWVGEYDIKRKEKYTKKFTWNQTKINDHHDFEIFRHILGKIPTYRKKSNKMLELFHGKNSEYIPR
jgi:hypothetical protein